MCIDQMNQMDERSPWRVFGSGYREAKPAAEYHTKDDSNSKLESFQSSILEVCSFYGSAYITYTNSYLEINVYLLTPYLTFPYSQAVHVDFYYLESSAGGVIQPLNTPAYK